jgi:hypothetical protein
VKRHTPKLGDVFTMPLDDERVAYGQVVAKHGRGFAFVAFDAFDATGSPDDEPAVAANRRERVALA